MRMVVFDLHSQGPDAALAFVAAEACTAHNALLAFNGVTPINGVLGVSVKDYYELDNDSCGAATHPAGKADPVETRPWSSASSRVPPPC